MAHLTVVTSPSSPPHVFLTSEMLTTAACASVWQLSHTDTEDVSCTKEWDSLVGPG